MDKDALYLEVDEDITSAIDKLKRASGKSVSIVVPKRSTLLQSVINQKLLQKAAQSSGKDLVLVTNDKVAASLAARTGLSVAATLGGKAAKLEAPAPKALAADEVIDESTDFEPEAGAVAVAPVMPVRSADSLSRQPKGVAAPAIAPLIAHKELSDEAEDAALATGGAAAAGPASVGAKAPKAGAPKVPDFTKLQRRLLWVGGAVGLVVAYLALMYFFSSAKVTLYAEGTKVDATVHLVADTNLTKSDFASGILAAQQIKADKDLTASFTPTGTKDIGTKSHGTVTLQNCEDSNTYPVSAGFALASQGLSFVTDAPTSIPPGTFSNGGKTCTSPKVSVAVSAAQSGDKYNLTNAGFTSSKLSANFNIIGSMSGGTTKTVKVVAQTDVDKARGDLLTSDKATQKELDGKVPSGFMGIATSFAQVAGEATVTPAVGEPADQATIAIHSVDSEVAVAKTDFRDAVRSAEAKAIGKGYKIYTDGLTEAKVTAEPTDPSGRQPILVAATASGGPALDTAKVAEDIKGKKYGEATTILSKLTGIQRSEIVMWPSWQGNLPQRPSNIKIIINVITSGG